MLLRITAIVVVLAVAGICYQYIGSRMDERRSPEPGRLVDIGGHRLKINCTGNGSPTVILESGLGDILVEWQAVQDQLSAFTRVCSYDRAGYGASDSGPFPRTSSQISAELHTLLQNAGEHPPFVLVGHSFGGYNVRVFNGRYPDEVVGLVLVDATQEDQYELLPNSWKLLSASQLSHYQSQSKWLPLQIDVGIARLRYRNQLGRYGYLILQSKYLKARASELQQIQASAEQARAAGAVGNEPIIVLTGTKLDDAFKNDLGAEDSLRFQQIWIKTLQPRLAQLSAHGRQVILPDAGHDIPRQKPKAIVEAVREIIVDVFNPR